MMVVGSCISRLRPLLPSQWSRCSSNKVRGLVFREAVAADMASVLALRCEVYRGLDYLPDYFHFFINDKNRRCVLGEINGKPVVFGVMLILDGGRSMLGQAGRVHEKYERRGLFGAMSGLLNAIAHASGCQVRVAMVEATLNKYARSEKFRKTHVEITSKLHYAGVVNHVVRDAIEHIVSSCQNSLRNITLVDTDHLLECFIKDEIVNTYLFPNKRMLVDYIPYQAIEQNVHFLRGMNTQYFSSVRIINGEVRGLLSAGSNFACSRPPESYTIDIFGTDYTDLESHIVFHLSRALELTKCEFCLQIFVEKGYISQELCNILLKLDLPKCSWYVEVCTKYIVEDVLKNR